MLCAVIAVVLALGGEGGFVYGRPQDSPQDQLEGPYRPTVQEVPLTFQGEHNTVNKVTGASRMYPFFPPSALLNNQAPAKAGTANTNDGDAKGQARIEHAEGGHAGTDGNDVNHTFRPSDDDLDPDLWHPSEEVDSWDGPVTSDDPRRRETLGDAPNSAPLSPGDESNEEVGSGTGSQSADDMADDLGLPVDWPVNSEEEDLGMSPYLRTRRPPQTPFQPSAATSSRKAGPAVSPDARRVHRPEAAGSQPSFISWGFGPVADEFVTWEELLDRDVAIDWPPSLEEDDDFAASSETNKAKSGKAAQRSATATDSREAEYRKDRRQQPDDGNDDVYDDMNEDGVPTELAVRVVQALQAEPEWRRHPELGAQGNWQEPWDEDDDDLENEEDRDWIHSTGSMQGSRLMGLIIESIGDQQAPGEDPNDAEPEDSNILDIFSNFPFQFLFGTKHSDNNADDNSDEDDDYYDYSDEYYDDYGNPDDDSFVVRAKDDDLTQNLENESDESDVNYSDEYDDVAEDKKTELTIFAVLSPLMK